MTGTRLLFVCAWMITIACGACASPVEQDLYLMEMRRELVGDTWSESGGCILTNFESGGGTWSSRSQEAGSDDYVVDMNGGGGSPVVNVSLSSAGEILEERDYDFAFLASGEVDRIDVVTAAGRVHQLVIWGGSACDYSAVPDPKP